MLPSPEQQSGDPTKILRALRPSDNTTILQLYSSLWLGNDPAIQQYNIFFTHRPSAPTIRSYDNTTNHQCSHTTDQQSDNPTKQQSVHIPNLLSNQPVIRQYYNSTVFSYDYSSSIIIGIGKCSKYISFHNWAKKVSGLGPGPLPTRKITSCCHTFFDIISTIPSSLKSAVGLALKR